MSITHHANRGTICTVSNSQRSIKMMAPSTVLTVLIHNGILSIVIILWYNKLHHIIMGYYVFNGKYQYAVG